MAKLACALQIHLFIDTFIIKVSRNALDYHVSKLQFSNFLILNKTPSTLQTDWQIEILKDASAKGCQIFLDTKNQNGEKYTKLPNITKWP
jgi:hypothetical protein